MLRFLKKILPKSISSRFFLILTVPIVLSQLIFGLIFFGKYTDKVITNMSDQIAGDIKVISMLLDDAKAAQDIESIVRNLDIEIELKENTKLKKIGIGKNARIYKILKNSLIKRNLKKFYIKPENKNITVILQSEQTKNSYKLLFNKQKLYTRIIPIVLGWGVASSIVLLIIAFIFLKNQIRPIKRLARAAERFGKEIDSNFQETNYVPEGAKEIRMAGIAFCEMKKNLRNLLNERLKTLAGISHDLKTPLTKMKLQLSLMPKTPEILGLMQDVNMMIEITNSFTLHANEQLKESISFRNLFSLLFEISKDFESPSFCVEIIGDKKIEIPMKYISLKRAFSNIVSNSKKYANKLFIEFKVENDFVKITFEDTGPGILPEILESIFSPFVSENFARTQGSSTSIGLGLSIARDAITDHGGEVSAYRSKKYGGAGFLISLPKR